MCLFFLQPIIATFRCNFSGVKVFMFYRGLIVFRYAIHQACTGLHQAFSCRPPYLPFGDAKEIRLDFFSAGEKRRQTSEVILHKE